MTFINYTVCGKQCKAKRIRLERGEINPDTFRCQHCNHHGHRVVAHPDLSMQRKLKEYASIRDKIL